MMFYTFNNIQRLYEILFKFNQSDINRAYEELTQYDNPNTVFPTSQSEVTLEEQTVSDADENPSSTGEVATTSEGN